MNRKAARALIALTMASALAAAAASASEIYRWTDENGNVYYTDKPIGEASERLDIQSKPTSDATVQAQLQAVVDRQAAAEEAKAKKAEQQASDDEMMAERKERKDKCSMYQERLTRYTQNRRLYRQDENGERVYLDEDQMANVRAETEQKVQEYCNNS